MDSSRFKKVNTAFRRRIGQPSTTIYIDTSDVIIKQYMRVAVNSPSAQLSWQFVDRLNSILASLHIPNPNNVVLKQRARPDEETYYDLYDWHEMPQFTVHYALVDCTSVYLEIEVIDNEAYKDFVHSFFVEFNIPLTTQTKSVWYPNRPRELSMNNGFMYICPVAIQPKYPIYIISKGRHERRLTSRYLDWCGIDYKIVVEPDERPLYEQHISSHKVISLPVEFLNKGQGSIPARNFVWKHAKETGAERHWILDDNISQYVRCNNSTRLPLKGGAAFRVIEDYVDRYTNVKMSGHNYTMFAVTTNTMLRPVTLNTRIYSSILLSNDIYPEMQWRGKYNEDTDLSLRILKAGYPTVLFNCVLADKKQTLTQKGGNTDSIYAEENALLKKAESLHIQHPDEARVTHRFGRTHHYVDYSPFKDLKPTLVAGIKDRLTRTIFDYGIRLVPKEFEVVDTNGLLKETVVSSDQSVMPAVAESERFPGVSWEKSSQSWRCRIRINGKRVHLGRFKDRKDAIVAYINKAFDVS